MKNKISYLIADSIFQINGDKLVAVTKNITGFETFHYLGEKEPNFQIFEQDELEVFDQKELLYQFEVEQVNSAFSKYNKGYLLTMKHENGDQLTLWSYSKEHQVFIHGRFSVQLLRFALWIAYGLMNIHTNRIALHGSCIINQGKAFLFLGESGTGKSTHTQLWRKHIPGSFLLNDDSPILYIKGESVLIYGSPWSGKTPCYKQEYYPLQACVRLSQASFNQIKKLNILQSFSAVHPSCPPSFAYADELYDGVCQTLDKLLYRVPTYHLACLPNQESAELAYQTLSNH